MDWLNISFKPVQFQVEKLSVWNHKNITINLTAQQVSKVEARQAVVVCFRLQPNWSLEAMDVWLRELPRPSYDQRPGPKVTSWNFPPRELGQAKSATWFQISMTEVKCISQLSNWKNSSKLPVYAASNWTVKYFYHFKEVQCPCHGFSVETSQVKVPT